MVGLILLNTVPHGAVFIVLALHDCFSRTVFVTCMSVVFNRYDFNQEMG
jgi:hypothetical protein